MEELKVAKKRYKKQREEKEPRSEGGAGRRVVAAVLVAGHDTSTKGLIVEAEYPALIVHVLDRAHPDDQFILALHCIWNGQIRARERERESEGVQ
jgi:hypothetical protein